MTHMLRRVKSDSLAPLRRAPIDALVMAEAARIVEAVRVRGEAALRDHASRLGDWLPGQPLIYQREDLEQAAAALDGETVALLRRTCERIRRFAEAQLAAVAPMACDVPGGRAGHDLSPVERAGCYAPGGRYPLPSTVLMTAVTARVAGVESVWVASPRPAPVVLAAAAIAGAEALLAVGGAQAIAALAYGAGGVPACDVVVGPGNRYVTAAKQIVSGVVRIDMPAGPSELVVLADESADARLVAADLLAQAEHDVDARAIVVSTSPALLERVESQLAAQLADLPTRAVARAAIERSFAVVAESLDAAVEACNRLAPEHLQVVTQSLDALLPKLRHYGALFIGGQSPEVFGDYGIGPNHVLPTGGSARGVGGLSILTFLRLRTWLRVCDLRVTSEVATDAACLARLEGLEGHARSALLRVSGVLERSMA